MNIGTLISTLIGCILTILVAIIFYVIGSRDLRNIVKELKQESEQIKRQNRIVLGYMERAGLVQVHRDANNEILEPVKTTTASSFKVD